MDIACRRRGPLTVIDLTGRWSIGAAELEVLEFRTLVSRLIATGCVRVAINLTSLLTLDARGLGEFAEAYKKLRSAGGELTLVRPNRFVRRMLAVTRLDSVIPYCDSESDLPSASGIHRRAASAVSRTWAALAAVVSKEVRC